MSSHVCRYVCIYKHSCTYTYVYISIDTLSSDGRKYRNVSSVKIKRRFIQCSLSFGFGVDAVLFALPCVRVCAKERERARARARARESETVCKCVSVCTQACLHTHTARASERAYACACACTCVRASVRVHVHVPCMCMQVSVAFILVRCVHTRTCMSVHMSACVEGA